MNHYAETLLPSFPKNTLNFITIQFPDPWFKRKHNKRRVLSTCAKLIVYFEESLR